MKNQRIVLASALLALSGLSDAQTRSGDQRAAQRTPVLPTPSASRGQLPPELPSVAAQTRFRLAPIPGMTVGTHAAPEYIAVPAATPVSLEVQLSMPHSVRWSGAVETAANEYSSRADVIEDGTGSTLVFAQVFDLEGRLRHSLSTQVEFVPVFSMQQAPEVNATKVLWHEPSQSFEVFQAEEPLGTALVNELLVGESMTLTAGSEAELASTLEWSLDGEPVALGPAFSLEFPKEGQHIVAVGPPDSSTTLQFEIVEPEAPGTAAVGPFARKAVFLWCFSHVCTLQAHIGPVGGPPGSVGFHCGIQNSSSSCIGRFQIRARYVAPGGWEWRDFDGHKITSVHLGGVSLKANEAKNRVYTGSPTDLSQLFETPPTSGSGAAKIILDVHDVWLAPPAGFLGPILYSVTVLNESVGGPGD